MRVASTPPALKPLRQALGGINGWQVGTLIVVWLATMGIGYAAYERTTTAAPSVLRGQLVAVQRGSIAATVSTTGSVVAATTAKVAFKGTGRLAELLVQVGDSVKQGQVLARLDQTDLQLQVTQSRAGLASAEAKLAQMEQGSRRDEITAAEANVASAKAKLAQVQGGPTEADVQAAQAGVASAKSNLAAAQAKLADLRAQPKPEDVRTAQLQLERAKNSLWATQIDRDGTCGNARTPEYQCNAANARVAAAETDVTSANENLAKSSKPAQGAEIKGAEEAVASAQVSYDSAQAKLRQVKAGATTADVSAAQAAVDAAASQLTLKRTPYTDADILGAKASVEQAKAGLALAQYQLDNAALLAPFAGHVAAIGMNAGEVTGGSSAITLVDPKAVRSDATVDESDVAKLELGQAAEITFDALPARRFAGKVIAVAPSATVQSGVVTYLVSLSIDDAAGLKPGMTANANIVYSRKDDVLLVPNRAIRAQGRDRVVEVAAEGGSRLRPVRVGISNEQFTEISEGLQEGEEVLISNTGTTAPRIGGGVPGGGFGGPPPGGAIIR